MCELYYSVQSNQYATVQLYDRRLAFIHIQNVCKVDESNLPIFGHRINTFDLVSFVQQQLKFIIISSSFWYQREKRLTCGWVQSLALSFDHRIWILRHILNWNERVCSVSATRMHNLRLSTENVIFLPSKIKNTQMEFTYRKNCLR